MADVTDQNDQGSPLKLEDIEGNSIPIPGDENHGIKRQRPPTVENTQEEEEEEDKPGRERRKIEIKFIADKSRRHITFSKRKAGIMKKAYELSILTGTQVLLLVVSETGLVYTFTTPKLQPIVTRNEGKNLIQACLNAPEPIGENGLDDPNADNAPDDSPSQQHQQNRSGMPQQSTNLHSYNIPTSLEQQQQQQQAIAYQNYLSQQQRSGYPIPQTAIPQQHTHQA
ncbi:Transcription factor of morphogenesis MCM1 [Erysiphe necator]|uniref:Putative srf-type transcription factor n=1 Tax=Uncinula necator TaxID=52586 RepID=A0A0B1NYH0_UNCNE|nr:Transcription factor of morphogenesis MCM1 [Erysiphe necator]KHJ31023.1 putative srf-type transcription factor [Erysiphe necator]